MDALFKRKLTPDQYVPLAVISAMGILILVISLYYRSMAVSAESEAWVQHSHLVSSNLENMLYAMTNIDASGRAFIATGDESYLESWRLGLADLKRHLEAVRVLTRDNPVQQANLPALDLLVAERAQVDERIGASPQTQAKDGAAKVVGGDERPQITKEFRQVVQRMQGEESGLLDRRTADAKRRLLQVRIGLLLGTALGLLITGVTGLGLIRSSRRRRLAEEALRVSEDQYRTLLNEVQDHAIFMLDPLGHVVTWNAGAERINGYTAKEIIGRNFSCFFPRADIEAGKPAEMLKIAAAEGRQEEHGRRVRKNGSQYVSSTTYTALLDRHGGLRGFSEITRDLSETKESGAKYLGLLEAAPDAMVVVNQSGEIVLVNLQAEKQFGYHRDELLGQKVSNIVPQGFAERLVADGLRSAEEALAQQIGTGIELTARRKDGSEFPIEIMLSPLRSPNGILVTAAIRNISVRKAAETHLVQMEGRYRGLLEAAPDAMVVVNQQGEIVLLNLQAEKQFGYRRDELLGQKVSNIVPQGFAERLVADGLRSAEEALAQQIGTGIELTARRKDGSEFPIEIMLSPLGSAEGILVTAAIRDISVRNAADAHLVQMEGRYRGLLEAAPDAMVVVNQQGEIVLLNLQAEKQFGYRRDELLGQKVSNIVPQGFAERLVADGLRSAEEALAQQIGTGIELTARRKDGTEFPIEIMLSPLDSAEGILVTAAIRDISVRNAADAHLVQMEGRYRGLLEAAPDAMVVVNQQGEIVLLNLQAEKQFGYRRDELLGQKVSNIVPQGFAERLVADGLRSAEEALAQQIGTGIELTARRKDGTEFPIEIMLSPLGSAEGILVTAAIRDISVRNAADAHLVQMEGRYRGLLEAAPDAMVVVNQTGEIVLVNLQTEKQFGYRRDELLGQKVSNIVPQGFAERLVADGLRSAEEALAQQIGTGIELTARRKDGSEFPIEIMLSPLGSAEGILVTAAIRDISVRNAADAHLVQMEGRYRGLLEAAPDAMVVVNQQGEIVLLNLQAEKRFGYRRDELLGQKLTNIIPEGFAERLIADGLRSAEDALAQQIGTGLELTALRKDGSRFPMELMLSPLESDTGTLVTVAIRDITVRNAAGVELLETVEELKRSNEDLQQFAYVASHDLQEPLRMVASYVALIARRYKGKLDADADEFISFAVDGAKRMQSLIQDLLAFSRVGSKGVELVSTSSENALNRAIKNLRGAIVDSGARVTHDPLPSVLADEMQLTQLFQNLLGNAIKYRRADTPGVHVAARQNGAKKWIFSVQDNGLGIEPQYFERIFGMFQRLHGREEFSGTGMGLAICKKIVERHGGDISVESTIGQGSTFRFSMAAGEIPTNALVATA